MSPFPPMGSAHFRDTTLKIWYISAWRCRVSGLGGGNVRNGDSGYQKKAFHKIFKIQFFMMIKPRFSLSRWFLGIGLFPRSVAGLLALGSPRGAGMPGERLKVLLLSLQRCWVRAMAFAMRDGYEAADLLWRRRELILFFASWVWNWGECVL